MRGIICLRNPRRPSPSAFIWPQLPDLCFAWWSSPAMLPGPGRLHEHYGVGSERFAAALRDAKTGLGRYPRIALRSIRGYFRSFPPGRMQLVLRSWQRMEPPPTRRIIHAIAGMSRPTQFTVCAAGTLFYARGQPFSGCDGERIPGRRAVSSLADCWTVP